MARRELRADAEVAAELAIHHHSAGQAQRSQDVLENVRGSGLPPAQIRRFDQFIRQADHFGKSADRIEKYPAHRRDENPLRQALLSEMGELSKHMGE